ncbi:hypothetical protein PLICRDRAFT_34534 [Plicaturopsis crispa FD-325 SS-3]|nr:hypothetical protein PLICRDRAFT_34534 [Plicaturopsis crispa FD-325 SS-3]
MASLQSPTLSDLSENGSDTTLVGLASPPPPEVADAKNRLAAMKDALDPLGKAFDSLGEQTAHIALLGGDLETAKEINNLRREMRVQDQHQKNGIYEIQLLLRDVLENEIIEHIRWQIEKEIEEQIDIQVEEQLALHLEKHAPQALQDEVAEQRRELEELQRQLHNSESRRANAALRSTHPHDTLHTILRLSGGPSPVYPKDLQGLFDLDDALVIQLMTEYELPDISDNLQRNVNRFMHFCGVTYQLALGAEGFSPYRKAPGRYHGKS